MYNGIVTPMLTPFNRAGEIDYDATRLLIQDLKGYGVSGLFPMGSTGLFPMFSLEERKKFLQFVSENRNNLTVYAGVGSSSTQESIELSKFTEDVGIEVRVLMPTYYIKPDEEWMYKHFSEVISASSNDLFIYNIPQLAGSWVPENVIKKLKSEFSQVKGIKDSSGDMRFFSRIVTLVSKDFSVFQGQDDLLLTSMALGANGGVCGLSNISGSIVDLYKAFQSGDLKKSREIQLNKVNPLMYAVNAPTFPSGYYYAFYKKHNINGGYRSPMVQPSKEHSRVIDEATSQQI
ncbi:dihydrodipicolinate synthase [Thermoplasma volcanium GSS1]|uniref:Dihydrodipicolinate synthase n=1 Tax=Thermoplasma volcanium (strain ATCC 51530 / DSM 4299 / JCM 9571 / NBRC 15438 / GSS1) TaxID=273116 RepID=Q979B0_THEVO|nr:dihydrodipicolinate synthase family protein [Thermoplasma volcanium]BAB60394.1 dihydrodipicolinate synthase [Thermoplasma volcanium GSS1]